VASPRLRFGTDYYALEFDHYAKTIRTAEEIGLDLVGHGDSQNLWHDVYVGLTVAAMNSSRIRIGPMVTNPVTRHPAVTAGALSSLQELSGGRVVAGIGGGDSAVLNIGARPAPFAEFAEYVSTVRELTSGRAVNYQGNRLQLQWARRPVPVYISAEGPRKLRLAGAIADGAIVSNGLTREVIADTIQTVAEGARAAGRSPDEIEIWWVVNFAFAPTEEEGLDELSWLLAGSADHVFRFSMEGKRVPPEHADGVRELMANYQHSRHSMMNENPNGALVDTYGLRQWLGERFAVTGPPAHCVERLREIISYGATNLIFTQLVPDQIGFMQKLRAEVLDVLQPL
jgi:5,10-methylenetetrahydromethanopterin reductase